MFNLGRGALTPQPPKAHTGRIYLCVPTLVYRVTAPVIRTHRINIFEKVTLSLCRAGIRTPEQIAERIHQDVKLCTLVLEQLRTSGQLDKYFAPTEAGLRSMTSGQYGEQPEIIVTHVFQDPFTGELWPRVADTLVHWRVRQLGDGNGMKVQLQPRSTGHPDNLVAHVLSCATPVMPTPRPDRIIAAVGAHRAADIEHRAEQFARVGTGALATFDAGEELRALSEELTATPSDDLRTIVDIRKPTAEYLLAWLDGDQSGETTGWLACDPFGFGPSPMLERLVLDHLQDSSELGADISALTAESITQLSQRSQLIDRSLEKRIKSALVDRFDRINEQPEALDLMTAVELAATKPQPTFKTAEDVAGEAFRLYETLFRKITSEYPPKHHTQATSGHRLILREELSRCAENLGFSAFHGLFPGDTGPALKWIREVDPDKRTEIVRARTSLGFVKELVPFALLGAAGRSRTTATPHPLAVLAERRPNLFPELADLSNLRNRVRHGPRDRTAAQEIDWSRDMASAAVTAFLALPPQRIERIPS